MYPGERVAFLEGCAPIAGVMATKLFSTTAPLFSFEGLAPTVHPDAFVAPTATLVGDVRVEANASIWYGAVLRADFGPIIVREGANVQDGCVVHGGDDPITESARVRRSGACAWCTVV